MALFDDLIPQQPKPAKAGTDVAIFAGPKSETADLDLLKRAKEMAQDKAAMEDIWSETGWFTGEDGRWRYEIPDEDAYWEGGEFKHDKLREAYPELIDSLHYSIGRMPPDVLGGYNAEDHTMSFNENVPPDVDTRDTAVHELQHVVQDYEGFAQGGSPSAPEVQRWVKSQMGYDQDVDPGEIPPEDQPEINKLLFQGYEMLGGEDEAAAVTDRRTFTPEQRTYQFPFYPADDKPELLLRGVQPEPKIPGHPDGRGGIGGLIRSIFGGG